MRSLLSVVLVLTLVDHSFLQQFSCTDGWVGHHSKCYFFSKTKQTFADASALCRAFNSKLAEPVTQDELNFLTSLVVMIGQSASYYIGVTDSFLEGQWVYSYARTLIRVRPHWLNGGPDNYHNEDCVEVVSSQSGQWSDVQCTTSLFYICEYDNDVAMSEWVGVVSREVLLLQ